MKYKKTLLCLMLAASLTGSCIGCSRKNTEEKQTTGGSENTSSTREAENLSGSESPTAQTEEATEPTTESPYNEDGTRRAWIDADTRLNVRKEASAEAEFIGSFNPRAEIKLLEEETVNGFYHVSGTNTVDGKTITGYAKADYITTDFPEDPKVSLEIGLYSQYDERWKDITLGNTSKTMYDVGCATCCYAMSENFLKNITTNPMEYAQTTRYTAKGDIVWPKDYYWNYNKDLQFMYNKLKAGIPVLVNATRKNGSPHWVLVVGYTGDGVNLKTSDFVINDPLPFGRTTLKEFFDEYPKFKKMIYYCEDRALVEGSAEWMEANGITTGETETESEAE